MKVIAKSTRSLHEYMMTQSNDMNFQYSTFHTISSHGINMQLWGCRELGPVVKLRTILQHSFTFQLRSHALQLPSSVCMTDAGQNECVSKA